MAWVFSAFTFAYAAFEIPSGWLGDVIGPRKVLARIVMWWSTFTALTGAAWNFPSLIATRFLFGMGEAGAFPNMSRSFTDWIPADERGRAHGLIIMGTRAGGALTPPLMLGLMGWLGWRGSFVALGAVGLAWCVCWLTWFTNDPADHPSVGAAELDRIRRGRVAHTATRFTWRQMLSGNLILVYLMYFAACTGCTSISPGCHWYLREARGFTTQQAAWSSGLVLMGGAIGTWMGGRLTDALARRYGLRIARATGVVALPLSGVFLVAAALVVNPVVTVVLLTLTLWTADLMMAPAWSLCHDLGGSRAGIVTGTMNTFGNIGGAISPLVVGYAVQWWQSWTLPFFVTGAVYVVGGVLTLAIEPRAARPAGTWTIAERCSRGPPARISRGCSRYPASSHFDGETTRFAKSPSLPLPTHSPTSPS